MLRQATIVLRATETMHTQAANRSFTCYIASPARTAQRVYRTVTLEAAKKKRGVAPLTGVIYINAYGYSYSLCVRLCVCVVCIVCVRVLCGGRAKYTLLVRPHCSTNAHIKCVCHVTAAQRVPISLHTYAHTYVLYLGDFLLRVFQVSLGRTKPGPHCLYLRSQDLFLLENNNIQATK